MAAPKRKLKKPAKKKASRFLDLRKGKPVRHARQTRAAGVLALQKPETNPIIEPEETSHWESKATFNPSVLYGDGKIHLIYRAIGDNDVSMIGYARSSDGITIDYRSKNPVFFPNWPVVDKNQPQVSYLSGGGGGGGTEDPRLTRIGDTVYMLYTAFDGWGSIRIALTSISFEDFVNERWHWTKPVFISPPGEINKNWVLFPEKINGRYAILHGITPHILIDYVDDLNKFDGTRFIHSMHPEGGREDFWDTSVRGVGPAPIKTKYGWLVLYHAMDISDPNRYKLGAMLLDLKEPTKIVARSPQPILEPDELYENQGFKSGVVYACGAAVADGWLFVYYGGADKVVCVAAAELDPFLRELIATGLPRLSRKRLAINHRKI